MQQQQVRRRRQRRRQGNVVLAAMVASLAVATSVVGAAGTDLTLNLLSQKAYPHAKCMDGTPPGYYFREGTGTGSKSVILFLEGGGW
jgi:hypothetical protein